MKRLQTVTAHLANNARSASYKAAWLEKDPVIRGNAPILSIKDLFIPTDIQDSEVLVKVDYSTINYKDALGITKLGIVRTWPMVPGIDFAGVVEESRFASFKPGDKVVMNGWGAGETHWGGLAQYAKVKAGHIIPLPSSLTTWEAMAIGTAGYTAMLSVLKLQDLGVTPEKGKVIVTGAAGGVGSFAVAILSSLGYNVTASTGRVEEHKKYLESLGAKEVVDRKLLTGEPKPLGAQLYAGAVDSTGDQILANVLSQMSYGGAVAACGLAAGSNLKTTVMPFILRGVTLAGIDSVMCSNNVRIRAWNSLAEVLDRNKLKIITNKNTVPLSKIGEVSQSIMQGTHRGRVVVDVNA